VIGIAQPRQIAPGTDEGLLHRVLCQVGVPKDQPGGCVQPPQGAIDELGEGVMIASVRPVDEPSLFHDRLGFGTTTVVALNRVWRRYRAKRSSRKRTSSPGLAHVGSAIVLAGRAFGRSAGYSASRGSPPTSLPLEADAAASSTAAWTSVRAIASPSAMSAAARSAPSCSTASWPGSGR
jgi:hypothetical protein